MACGLFQFAVQPKIFNPNVRHKCCSCGAESFEIFSRFPLDATCHTCSCCKHLMFVRLLQFPMVFKGCALCHHSCATCSVEPPRDLIVRTTCGTCLAVTQYIYEAGDMTGEIWRSVNEYALSCGVQWNKACRGCGHTPTTGESTFHIKALRACMQKRSIYDRQMDLYNFV